LTIFASVIFESFCNRSLDGHRWMHTKTPGAASYNDLGNAARRFLTTTAQVASIHLRRLMRLGATSGV